MTTKPIPFDRTRQEHVAAALNGAAESVGAFGHARPTNNLEGQAVTDATEGPAETARHTVVALYEHVDKPGFGGPVVRRTILRDDGTMWKWSSWDMVWREIPCPQDAAGAARPLGGTKTDG